MYIALIKHESAGTYVPYLTSGKTYIAERVDAVEIDKLNPTTIYKRHEYAYGLYKMYSDNDAIIYTTIVGSSHLNGNDWEVIESFEV
jgi:hypothetical protein